MPNPYTLIKHSLRQELQQLGWVGSLHRVFREAPVDEFAHEGWHGGGGRVAVASLFDGFKQSQNGVSVKWQLSNCHTIEGNTQRPNIAQNRIVT